MGVRDMLLEYAKAKPFLKSIVKVVLKSCQKFSSKIQNLLLEDMIIKPGKTLVPWPTWPLKN